MTADLYRARHAVPWDRVAKVTHCVDCLPGSCPMNAFVKDGVVVREESSGNIPPVEPGVPDMNPLLCQKGLAWSRQLRSPDRLLHPMRRIGPRGSGEWETIGWEEAFDEVAEAMLDAICQSGPEAIVQECTPQIGMLVPTMRFGATVGTTRLDVNASINDFWAGFQQVYGKFFPTFSYDDLFHSDVILIWHANPAYTAIPLFHYMTEARYRGAQVVLIAPDVSPSHTHADLFVPVQPGTDAALAMSMAQVILSEGIGDESFVRTQTDLSLLVRRDTGRYLRSSDVEESGRDDRFFHATDTGPTPADPADLLSGSGARLEGSWTIHLVDGSEVEVEPLLAMLRRTLDTDWTPEKATAVCGVHPETIRHLARMVAAGRTHVLVPAGMAKYFHGDLIARGVLLVLALTGNWGRKGSGTGGWATIFDGQFFAMSKPTAGIEGADAVMGLLDGARSMLAEADPTLSPELAGSELWRNVSQISGMVPPFFFWYQHAGFAARQNDPVATDPTQPRPFEEYYSEAMDAKWWPGADRSDLRPRVLLEIAGNMLRRTRGGKTVLLEHLWPQLDKVVVIDVRLSETARHADIVLPAAHSYEKVGFGMPTPWTMILGLSDKAVEPAGEALGEWEILTGVLAAMERLAASRGVESYTDSAGAVRRFEELVGQFTFGGALRDEADLANEMIRDAELVGNLPQGTTLETLRNHGWTRFSDWGPTPMSFGQASPFPVAETHCPLRNHVELGHPYPTLTRRAQFLLEHPWFEEAGEQLPTHKDPPALGGDHRFRITSGHNRWSIHAMNITNPLLLGTHRGRPFALVNDDDAAELGVEDDGEVRIFNDHGEFHVEVRTSPAQKPGMVTVYNGFEGFHFPGGSGPNEVEPGVVKWLGLAGGYGHLRYAPTEWQPIPADRCVSVSIEAAPKGA